MSCLQCHQQTAQATGAANWQSAWQSTRHQTDLSTLSLEPTESTTAVPHTAGEYCSF